MPDHHYEIMDNLIQYLLFELKNKNMTVDEFRMQKLIFKIKMELGETHELYSELPFYWYLKGPYSEIITESFNNRNFNRESTVSSDFPEIKKITQSIIRDRNFFYNCLDKEIYKQYAPYKFMFMYKYGIYDISKKESITFDIDDFIGALFRCEGNLPVNKYFNEFSSIFSRLISNLDLINESGNFNENWIGLRESLLFTWQTFAKGIRVEFCDDYYKNRIGLWDMEFKESLKKLRALVNKTEFLIDFSNISKQDYAPEDIRLLNLIKCD